MCLFCFFVFYIEPSRHFNTHAIHLAALANIICHRIPMHTCSQAQIRTDHKGAEYRVLAIIYTCSFCTYFGRQKKKKKKELVQLISQNPLIMHFFISQSSL